MLVEQLDRLEKALELDGGHTLGDVLEMVERETAQLWESPDAVIVTEVHDFPRQRVLHFWLAAGEKDAVIELSHRALAWGRTIGCQRATLSGRRGWERALAKEGWTADAVLMGREI